LQRLERLKGLRVFIVEDEAMIALAIEDILQELGCDVVGHASNLSRAFRTIDRIAFDVATLDINLGRGERVFPFAEELITRGVPFAFLSAYHPIDGGVRFVDVPILAKPIDPGRLTAALLGLAPKR